MSKSKEIPEVEQPSTSSSNFPDSSKVISYILKSFNIDSCEPSVILALLELSHKFTIDILKDAKLFQTYLKRNMTLNDIKMAIRTGKNSAKGINNEVIAEMALKINSRPLAESEFDLVRLPSEKESLLGAEYERKLD